MEVQPTIEALDKFAGITVDVLLTGVGVTATTYNLTKTLLAKNYDVLVQAGIVGSLHPSLLPLTPVVVGSEYFGDLGVQEGKVFRSLFDLGLVGNDEAPWTDARLLNPHDGLMSTAGLERVQGITVQEITTNPERVAHYAATGAQVESMEGAAFHYVAILENIPFVQLRAVSNFAGDRNKANWMIPEAISELNRALMNLLQKITGSCN